MESVPAVLDILQKTYLGQKGAVELGNPYKVLFATIISQRNKDELTEKVSAKLFKKYPTIRDLATAKPKEVSKTIYPSGFYNVKGRFMVAAAKEIVEKYSAKIPNNLDALTGLPGVGRKTANCVLVYGYGQPEIVVDTHVHRISQRLGWIQSKNPTETESKLAKVVPKKYWKTINTLFVKHGKTLCLPVGPRCWDCPVLLYCPFGNSRVKSLVVRG